MCGLLGCLDLAGAHPVAPIERVQRALPGLRHRGPDDTGTWCSADGRLALGHTRLAILDTGRAGHQPMVTEDGRYVLVFNGEIYNHLALRKDLQGVSWRGHSDTETLLAAFSRWGVDRTLARLRGMFALALVDRDAARLYLVRDRLGEKPLYHAVINGAVVFASELAPLRDLVTAPLTVDQDAVADIMRQCYVAAPATIYREVSKLSPGCLAEISLASGEVSIRHYWTLAGVIEQAGHEPAPQTREAAVRQLDVLLEEVVSEQMISDVPLGAFLSGGIDSSIVTMYMQRVRKVRTFTIGFDAAEYNEASVASEVARRLGSDHTEIMVSGEDALDVVPALPAMFSEPFSDSSQIPSYLVARAAVGEVTVALSGDGADESFAGYNRHVQMPAMLARQQRYPTYLRQPVAGALRALSGQPLDLLEGPLRQLPFVGKRIPAYLSEKLRKLADVLSVDGFDATYRALCSHWQDVDSLVLGTSGAPRSLDAPALDAASLTMYHDGVGYLHDDVLTKVDRATMAASLESRAPFLDPRLVAFAWRCPIEWKLADGKSKWLLRQLLYPQLGRALVDRPKMGFSVPLDSWLRGPLREWGEALLVPARLESAGINPLLVQQKWQEHQSGRRNWQYHLWNVLMYQAWRQAHDI